MLEDFTTTDNRDVLEPELLEKTSDPYLVIFDGSDDKEDASRLSRIHKWTIVGIISIGSVCYMYLIVRGPCYPTDYGASRRES